MSAHENDAAPGEPVAALQGELVRTLAFGGNPGAILAEVIPGGTLDAAGALEVYRRGYLARLTEQLGETYPSVWRVLGDDAFFEACEAYIAGHPSASYNLSDYGRAFADHLEACAHARELPFLAELARFELAVHDLFHAAGHDSLTATELASLGDLEGVRLRLGSAVLLVACERAVYDVFRHRHDEEAPDLDLERRQLVLMFKQDGEVMAREVDAGTFAALGAMGEGLAVEEALAAAVVADPAYGAAEVAKLFELVARCGLVAAVER